MLIISRRCNNGEKMKLGPPIFHLAVLHSQLFLSPSISLSFFFSSHHLVSFSFFLLHTLQSMDSPVLNHWFRQLFRHPACQSLRRHPSSSLSRPQSRSFFTRFQITRRQDDGTLWTKRGDYVKDFDKEYWSFPTVTAKELRNRRERPRQVKLLTREFIDGKYRGVVRGYRHMS